MNLPMMVFTSDNVIRVQIDPQELINSLILKASILLYQSNNLYKLYSLYLFI